MGDPKRQRKLYSKPMHHWDKERIEEENALMKEYGFKNKRELWKMTSMLRKFKERAKQYVKEDPKNISLRKELIKKLYSLGLVDLDAKIDDILGLPLKKILDRRIQTIVFKKGLALSIRQARQFIVHGAIMIGDRKITSPSYIVKRDEEDKVRINPKSKLSGPDHPEMLKVTNKVSNEKNKITEEATQVNEEDKGEGEKVKEKKVKKVSSKDEGRKK